MLIELMGILTTVLLLLFGVYFLKFKKAKNGITLTIGYLYSLFGVIGLVIIMLS